MFAAPPLLRPLLVLCLLLPIVPVSTSLVNITIDDTDGDVSQDSTLTFSPVGFWAQGQDCPTCNVHSGNTTDTIDVSQVFDGTWHDSTFHPGDPDHTITASFIGTAVYVYNIIGNQIPSTITFTNLTFWINSDLVGSYVHPPENTAGFEYGVLVYANTSLPNGQHFLTIRAGGGPNASLILFDRLVYTQDSSSSLSASRPSVSISFPSSIPLLATSAPASGSSKSSPPIGAIVGGVVGGVVGLAILGLVAFLVFRAQRQTAASPAAEKIDPFVFSGGAQHPQGRQMSRTPILPDLRFGRSRLMHILRGPGLAITSTDASSSTETPTADGFQGHRPRLPPMSPAETACSREAAEYMMSRIQLLEAQMRALEMQQQLGGPSDASGSRTQLSHGLSMQTRSRRSRSRGRSANASASPAILRSELASLRSEIAALRGELSQDQLGVLEAAPSYVS